LMNPKIVSKLFAEIAPRFAKRPGGYTRLIKTRVRYGDGARMAVVELVVQGQPAKPVKPEKTKAGPESNP